MAIHSSFLAWEIPWTEKPDGLQSMGVTKEQDTTYRLNSNNKPKTSPSNQQKPALAEHHPQGTPESLRSCTPKEHTEGRGGSNFWAPFLNSRIRSNWKPGWGWDQALAALFFFFPLSFQGVKSQQSDTYKSVSPKGEVSLEDRIAHPACIRNGDSSPRFLSLLSNSLCGLWQI